MNNSQGLAIIAGAVVGGVAGYLFLTDNGRRMRRELEPALEDFTRSVLRFQNTAQNVVGVAHDGWKLLTEVLESAEAQPRYPTRLVSPFSRSEAHAE